MTVQKTADRVYKRGTGMVKVYEHSPFLVDMDARVKRITNKAGDMMLVNREDGAVVNDVAGFWSSKEVDATQFVKLFVQGVRALTELTSAGTKMFEMLYTRMQTMPNCDRVDLAYWTIDQYISVISLSTYKRGMGELLAKGFIAATPSAGSYWINPNFMWNGDRLSFRNDYIKKVEKPRRGKATVTDPNQPALFSPEEDLN
jgi:hypothetical protein